MRAPSQNESHSSVANRGVTLTQRLLTFALPTALIPLVIAGGLEFLAVKKEAQHDALEKLQLESVLAAEAAHIFVLDTFKIPEVIGLNPQVQQALVAGANNAVKENMHNTSIAQLEQRFSQTKLLAPNSILNKYLKDVIKAENFDEIYFTERHGFNIAYALPTADFVQRDEEWWQIAREQGRYVGIEEFDEVAGTKNDVVFAQTIENPDTGQFLGVIKTLTSAEALHEELFNLLSNIITDTQVIEVLDTATGIPVAVLSAEGFQGDVNAVIGTDTIKQIAKTLDYDVHDPDKSNADIIADVRTAAGLPNLEIELTRAALFSGEPYLTALFKIDNEDYSMTTVPGTHWITLAAIDDAEIQAAGNELLQTFGLTTGLTTIILGLVAAAIMTLLARQLAAPLQSLTQTATTAAAGQLDTRVKLQGTIETQKLGAGFNTLLSQIQSLLQKQEDATAEQIRQRQALENDISQLMEDVGDAAEGDLRVQAKLSEGDVGIVADLFNAIIENLRLTTRQVKSSTSQVTTSLTQNEEAIRELSAQEEAEVEFLKETMEAVEDIAKSIQEVATNAGQASRLTQDTYATVKAGTNSMDQTVESVLGLRSTVGETAKKIKRLGESAQKIAQAVSLIDEIALKTNLLAVNASVEAARAGEMGEGFTAVAEQVGSLAEQSSAATKEIANIISSIQTETQEVVEAIEMGTAQVVDSTNLVETTKQRLAEVLTKSEQINNLMSQISASTQYQTESSAAVTELVKEVAEGSEQRSESSQQMAQAIQGTAQVAQALEASVEQFKL
ncbi:MAG: HAMP domain-containing protein [Cyanothece sp. SIO1E1]|nr:HAMP domain-containing protein [Cyanothece sp. SIO1E1]